MGIGLMKTIEKANDVPRMIVLPCSEYDGRRCIDGLYVVVSRLH